MPPAAPVRELITVVVPATVLALVAACESDPPATREPVPAPPAISSVHSTAPADAAVPADAPTAAVTETSPTSRITFSFSPRREPGAELARRCRLEGDPLLQPCAGRSQGIAVARDGALYVIAGNEIRRYARADDGEECRYTPRGAAIPLPPEQARPQRLDRGPVYMRSGGPAWHLARAGNAVYAVDFLGGLYRLEGDALRPACTEVFGYDHVVAHRGKLLVARRGVEQLVLGKAGRCKAAPVPRYSTERRSSKLHVVGDRVYLAAGGELARYDGGTATKLTGDADLCFVTDVTACGDGACVLDGNCPKLVQLDAGGDVVRTLDRGDLFSARPVGISDAVTLDSGAVLLLALHRDTAGGQATCEHAIYEVPAAVFSR